MESLLPSKRPASSSENSFFLKKARFDPTSGTEYAPTPVLFVRGLPSMASAEELLDVCSSVGVVSNLQMNSGKGQAFVEFDSQEAADFCVLHFSMYPASVQGSALSFSYSGRPHILQRSAPASPSAELLLTITQVKYPVDRDVLAKVLMPYGRVEKAVIFPRAFGFQCLVRLSSVAEATAAHEALDGRYIYSESNVIATAFSPMEALRGQEVNEEDYSKVAFIHHLGRGASPDMLFNLFSLYGNVLRVKIFHKRTDMALVQFEDHAQALNAKENLDKVSFLDSKMLVSISRNNFINRTKIERKGFYKDYGPAAHRYKVAGSKNFQNMHPPSPVLHLSNLVDSVNQKFFESFFSREIVSFKFLGEGRKMALARFKSVDDALLVLATHHNQEIRGRQLKIAFSKTNL